MKTFITYVGHLLFWSYFTVKFVGTTFAAWSWWWLLLPLVPWLGFAVQRLGL